MVRGQPIICAAQIHLSNQNQNQSITCYCYVVERSYLSYGHVCGSEKYGASSIQPYYDTANKTLEEHCISCNAIFLVLETKASNATVGPENWKHRLAGLLAEVGLAGYQILKHRAARAPLKVGRGRNYLWNALAQAAGWVGRADNTNENGVSIETKVDFGTPCLVPACLPHIYLLVAGLFISISYLVSFARFGANCLHWSLFMVV